MKKILTTLMLTATLAVSSTPLFAEDYDAMPVPNGTFREMVYSPTETKFTVWSPMATGARVKLYRQDLERQNPVSSVAMTSNGDGTWSVTVPGNKVGMYYTFQVEVNGKWCNETPGIFAQAVGINGKRAVVVDMKSTDPEGWNADKSPVLNSASDIVLYEMHYRDFSIDKSSGIHDRGKFLSLTETGTKNPAGLSTGIDHLKELGVTHVHLLPSFDFGSIDETTGKAVAGNDRNTQVSYNWGYDPVNYNVPEGSYSTNAAYPTTRIREFKEMVQAMHKAGLRVVLDVVFNHTFDISKSNFNLTAPGYFYRMKDGNPANGSGCGNETASERPMMRKFMIESVLYWMKEYHVDGFRFDLMGIHDVETMNAIREAAQKVDPKVFIYGEGWAASTPALSSDKLAMKANVSKLGGIAAFCDEMRDGLRGGWQNDKEGAFLVGKAGSEESIKFGIAGAISHPGVAMSKVNYSKKAWAAQPTECISYVSCHDDMCLADRLNCTLAAKGNNSAATREALQIIAETAVLTSQGVPFLWCGDEFMRDRKGVHNCYASPDSVNGIDWNLKTQHKELYNYIKGLIALRKAHPAFRMGSADLVRKNLTFLPPRRTNVIGYCINGAAVGDKWKTIVVILNPNNAETIINIPKGHYTVVVEKGKINYKGIRTMTAQTCRVPAMSATILYK